MLRNHLHWLALFILVLDIGFASLGFVGLARFPDIGDHVRNHAKRETFMVQNFIGIGDLMVRFIPGADAVADSIAVQAFSPIIARVKEEPLAAMAAALQDYPNDTHRWIMRAHDWFWVWVLFFAFAWWQRPRIIHTVKKSK